MPPIEIKTGVDPTLDRLTPSADGWHNEDQVDTYLRRVDRIAPRAAGEELLTELLPPNPTRLLDLGAGDGRLAALVLAACPTASEAVLVDNSAPMIQRARERFASDQRVTVVDHDLADPLPELGSFDVVVSGMALHHLEDPRKRSMFEEVVGALRPGGRFANLDVIASATPALHADFLRALHRTADDPEDRLAPVEDQLGWMRDAGLVEVDCLWRWRGLALMSGLRPD